MTEVHQINVVLTSPTAHRQQTWCYGFYIIEGDVLTMTDEKGKPATDPSGKTYSQKLDGESPRIIAARLTKKLRLAFRGKAGNSDFNRPLIYPKIGIA